MSTPSATRGVAIPARMPQHRGTFKVIASYVFDWLFIIVAGVIAAVLGKVEPNKRPFNLANPDISFPFTEKETVTPRTLILMSTGIPIIIITIVSLIFVPGGTVSPGTPRGLVWRRKLWELHAGLQGLALSLVTAWFVTNGMKNMFGRPRPDMLSRCQPNVDRMGDYIVGGLSNYTGPGGLLVSAAICTNPDEHRLDDGFRSFPSGHSSSAAAGLIYLSLFIASKFAVVFPFLPARGYSNDDDSGYSAAQAACAFPSRLLAGEKWYGMRERNRQAASITPSSSVPNTADGRVASHAARSVLASRRQAAAPPVYLLGFAMAPTFAAIFVASSRWFDFRHHGFDIMFGFTIGILAAFLAFRWYHLPLSQGAGWAWGPRSHDKAFWAGVGSYSYATDRFSGRSFGGGAGKDEEDALTPTTAAYTPPPDKAGSGGSTGLGVPPHPGNRLNSAEWSGGRAM